MNYLLKLPSDLDYISQYRAIRTWLGFRITRNPFCVPFPMEEGAQMFSATILQPKHLEPGTSTDGFSIGGMLATQYSRSYAPKDGAYASGLAGAPYQGRLTSSIPLKLSQMGDSSKSTQEHIDSPQMPSFILNEDMVKLRQAELVILKEEEKLGIYSLDPNGRLVPKLQVQYFASLSFVRCRNY